MVGYLTLTRHQAEQWQQGHPKEPGDPLTDMHLDYFTHYLPEEVVALLAVDADKIIGRILLAHSDILVDGTSQRFLIGQDLLVRDEYRRQAVGIQILARVLKLGRPYIAASVSAEMAQIFDAWRGFSKVDASPVYSVGIDLYGVVRTTRLALQRQHADGKTVSRFDTLRALLQRARTALQLRAREPRGFSLLPPTEAESVLDKVADAVRFRVQIPWNRNQLVRAIRGTSGDCRAFIFRTESAPRAMPRLVTIYLKCATVSIFGASDMRRITTAHLNEVFPPLDDAATARFVLGSVAREAAGRGASIIFVSATTPVLEAACAEFDLAFRKSVYVTTVGLDSGSARVVSDPANWWCRAINENQFEESYSPIVHGGVLV